MIRSIHDRKMRKAPGRWMDFIVGDLAAPTPVSSMYKYRSANECERLHPVPDQTVKNSFLCVKRHIIHHPSGRRGECGGGGHPPEHAGRHRQEPRKEPWWRREVADRRGNEERGKVEVGLSQWPPGREPCSAPGPAPPPVFLALPSKK